METFDVGIIGAGIHGASAAYHLASRGVSTVVVDKGPPAGGPTGRSSGVCRAYYTNEFLARTAHEGMEMLANFAEYTNGRDAGFRLTGFLFLHPGEDASQLDTSTTHLRQLGIPVDLLGPEQIATDFPWFDLDGIGAGVWEEDAGYADPVGATVGLLERAAELGAELRPWTRVTAIDALPVGGATVVAADGSRTDCSRLLIAGGPWTGLLSRLVGVELPLTIERHAVAILGWGGGPRLPFGHADLAGGYYTRPEGSELLLLGSLRPAPEASTDRFSEGIGPEESLALAMALAGRVPALIDAEERGGWASLYDVSPDWQPVIGEIADGIFVDAGTSGHGFKLAPALGRHVADLVMGLPTDPALATFSPERFAVGASLSAGYGEARILG